MAERIIMFSDIHIHSLGNDWRRVDDSIRVLEWVIEQARERDVKKVFFLGDFFHVRGYLYPSIVARAFNVLQTLGDIQLFMNVGNHDMPYRESTRHSSITAFGTLATIVDQPAVYEGDGFNFFWLPYVESVAKSNWALTKIAGDAINLNNGNRNILLAHLDINGAKYHSDIESTYGIEADCIDQIFETVITGHYHTHQKIGRNIYYIGSPYQQNFGEAYEDKGIIFFNDGKIEFIKNTFSPQYLRLQADEIDERITGNYISVTVKDSANIISTRERALQFNPRHVTVKLDRADISEDRKLISVNMGRNDVSSLLKDWIKKAANSAIYNHDKLYIHGMEIVSEADAK